MQNFSCDRCGNTVYFENVACVSCGSPLGFDPTGLAIKTLDAATDTPDHYYFVGGRSRTPVMYCANYSYGACNWLTEPHDGHGMCVACDNNRTIPNLQEQGNLEAWQQLERAKKRLIYSLFRLGLPIDATAQGGQKLTFDFVHDSQTGHLDGVITINVVEVDAVERERQRQRLDEPYRSVLGHLRHESGHFYWSVLVELEGRHDAYRNVFGDERIDYGQALQQHYQSGPPADWHQNFVSAYASSHPWEDFAETWAHYLHIVAAVDTALAESLMLKQGRSRVDAYGNTDFRDLISKWIPLSLAMNSLSRSMGHADYYPFVLSQQVLKKLEFVHQLIDTRRPKRTSRRKWIFR